MWVEGHSNTQMTWIGMGMHLEYADSVDHLRGEDSKFDLPFLQRQSSTRLGELVLMRYILATVSYPRGQTSPSQYWNQAWFDRSSSRGNQVDGDKIRARESMIKAQVPVIPGRSISISDGEDPLPQPAAAAAEVGYPLLLKASAGGGGKGMRVVNEPKLLRTEYQAASREATAAFGNGTVYVESLFTWREAHRDPDFRR